MRTIILFVGVMVANSISPIDANLRWWLPFMYFIAIVADLNADDVKE